MENKRLKKLTKTPLWGMIALLTAAGCAAPTGGGFSEDPFDDLGAGAEVSTWPAAAEAPQRPETGFVGVPDPGFHEEALLEMTQVPETSPIEQPIVEAPSIPVEGGGASSGYDIDGVCYPACASDSGGSQGWGWENDATCVAHGSLAASRGQSCGGEAPQGGSGFNVDGVCYPQCESDGGDADGWGWESEASCVVSGSTVAQNASSCGGASPNPGTGSTPEEPLEPGPNAGACPSTFICPSGTTCGCYTVPGLGARKSALLEAGAERYMLAAAMMETETMTTDYTYGDGKWDDSFNAGVCKQNWGMMRQCYEPWNGLQPWHYATSDVLNSSLELDVQVFSACRAHFGSSWWAGHRNGQSGIDNPNTSDIQFFRTVMDWTHQMIGNDHILDDVRFWVYVPAI